MSVIFVVAPAVSATWPVLAAAAAALAGRQGLKVLRKVSHDERVQEGLLEEVREGRTQGSTEVEVPLEGSKVMAEQLGLDSEIVFEQADGATIRLRVDERQQAILHVSGEGRSDEELQQIGQAFLGQLLQQYAYQTIVENLEGEGYSLVEEEADEDGRIHLRIRRWE